MDNNSTCIYITSSKNFFTAYYVQISPFLFILFTSFFFFIGVCGLICNLESLVFSLINLELILLSVNLNFIYFSIFFHDPYGQICGLLLLSVAACEATLGLSLLIISTKFKNVTCGTGFNALYG